MLTLQEEAYVSEKAYVPEHILNLMGSISKGEPFLKEDHLGFTKDNWLIIVGYPLDGNFSQERSERVLKQAVDTFRPEILWFIGPEILPTLWNSCKERETDQYYTIDLEQTKLKPSLQRIAEKASKELTVGRSRSFSKKHQGLTEELLKREKLPPRVRELYRAMPDYVSRSSTAYTINAWDKNGKLSAFFVVELGAKNFSTYVLGCHSKKHYVPHASDLLFFEMMALTREHGKDIINLGLGVNEGIRRFKEKWGGVPFLNYEFCEHRPGSTKIASVIRILEGKL